MLIKKTAHAAKQSSPVISLLGYSEISDGWGGGGKKLKKQQHQCIVSQGMETWLVSVI